MIDQPEHISGSSKASLHVIDLQPNMKFLIVEHRNNWDSLIRWSGNCPQKDKWTRKCFVWAWDVSFSVGSGSFAGTPCWECSAAGGRCCCWKLEEQWTTDQVTTECLSLILWRMFAQAVSADGKLSSIQNHCKSLKLLGKRHVGVGWLHKNIVSV